MSIHAITFNVNQEARLTFGVNQLNIKRAAQGLPSLTNDQYLDLICTDKVNEFTKAQRNKDIGDVIQALLGSTQPTREQVYTLLSIDPETI